MLEAWRREGVQVLVFAREKDITRSLLDSYGIAHQVLAPAGVGTAGRARELVRREIAMFRAARRFRPAIITGSSPNAARVARLVGAKSLVFCEDDAKIVPQYRWTAYPFASAIVTPQCLAYENYGVRHFTYPAYQKLFYLHPNRFTPDRTIFSHLGLGDNERFALVRLSSLQAHHDRGARGMSEDLLRRVVAMCRPGIHLFITSERPLPEEFEPLRLPIPPERIHDALASAEFFLGDSQSMTVESALLGTPAFKINTFAGIISVIRELEEYGLAFGYRPGQEDALLDELNRFLETPDGKARFQKRRAGMLAEKIDPLPWFLEIVRMFGGGAGVREVKAWSDRALNSGRFGAAGKGIGG